MKILRRLALAFSLTASVSPTLANQLTTSVALTDYLTYGISPSDGARGYGIQAGGISNIISAGLLYRGDYVPGQWGYWTYNEFGTTARYDPVQTGIMGGLAAKMDNAGVTFSPGGMAGMAVESGGNPPRIKYLAVPGTLRQSGLATLWVLHSWNDPSPWAGTTPPGGPGWGGYTWEPRFWGYSSALILEHATWPAPRVRGAGNGDFQTGDMEGWSSFAPDTGNVQVVTFPAGSTNFAAQLTTRRLAALTQLTLDGVDLGFLEFDYLFPTNRGRLEISLGGVMLGVIEAPDAVTHTMQHARLPVPAVVNQAGQPLVFELTGDAGEQVLLDNVGWLSALRILRAGSPQTADNWQVLPLEIQCLTNESCYVQVAPTITGPWQALITPFRVTADRMAVAVPILAGWPQAFYRLGLWQELKLVSQPQSATAFAGVGDGSLSVTPSGTGPFTYQWQRNGTNLPGQTSATLNLLNPQAADTAGYRVIVTDAAGASITSAPPALLTVQPFAGPTAWWPGDEHSFDLAGTNHGTPQYGLGYAAGKAGAAFNCANNGYLLVPEAPELNFGAGEDFTIAAWVNPQQFTSGDWNVIACKGDGAASQNGWVLSLYPNTHAVAITFYTNQNGLTLTATSAPPAGVWTHVAVQRAGGLARIYVNGVLETESAAPVDSLANTFPLLIGQIYDWRNNPPIQPANGAKSRVDELALFRRALSAAEIRALFAAGSAGLHRELMILRPPQGATAYVGVSNAPMTVLAAGSGTLTYQWYRDGTLLASQTTATLTLPNPQFSDAGNYTVFVTDGGGASLTSSPPATLTVKSCEDTVPLPLAWWPGENHPLDLISTNHGTPQGNVAYAPGKVGTALRLNGTNAFVEVPHADELNMLTGHSYSLAAWIKPTASNYMVIAHKGNDLGSAPNGRQYWQFLARFDQPGSPLELILGDTLGRADQMDSLVSLKPGVWQHVAVVVDDAGGPASGYRFYIDGKDAGRRVETDMNIQSINSTEPLRIGAGKNRQDEIQGYFTGQIDELMFFNRTLSAAEIARMHAAGSAGVCRP